MKLIIRYIKSKGVGRETHDVTFDGERATIGRGTDQSIQIQDRRIPLSHSVLMLSGEKLLLKAESDYTFTVNDHVSRSAELNDGDVVDILGHQIKVIPGDDRAEYIVEVDIEETMVEPLRDRFTTRLWQLGFPERRLAWLLFLSIIGFGVIVPSAGFFIGMDVLRNGILPDDSLWLAGKLHHTHAFIGEDCNFCHSRPFTPVRDIDCLNCHLSVNHHSDTQYQGADYKEGKRCADCHKEHTGPESFTRRDQAVCTFCHEDLVAGGPESKALRPVTDFLLDHPPFKVSIEELSANGEWKTARYDVWAEDLAENSNLIFPHDLHLHRDGIASIDGLTVLECSDCHVSEKGGQRMQIVTMEKHCASCHQLTFDPETPDRVVPHGSPEALIQNLQGYYAYQFLNRNLDEPEVAPVKPPSFQRQARRPGKSRGRQLISGFYPLQTETLSLTRQAVVYIESRVSEAALNLFERQTCTICHDVTRDDTQNIPWDVKPVKLTDEWFPMAEFSHDSHKNMQCGSCHEAENSHVATDVLMPGIGSCRSCHGGEDVGDRLQSTCISCHKYHLDDGSPMGALIAVDDWANLMDKTIKNKNILDDTGTSVGRQDKEFNKNE